MANKDMAQGLRPYGQMKHAGDYVAGTTIYPGDLVRMADTGLLARAAADTSANIGVALNYATTGQKVLVSDDPEQEYIVQCDDATVAAQTNVGLNYQIVVGTASTLFKASRMQLDASSGATDSNLPLRILRLDPSIDNEFGSKAEVIVKINNSQRGNGTVGL